MADEKIYNPFTKQYEECGFLNYRPFSKGQQYALYRAYNAMLKNSPRLVQLIDILHRAYWRRGLKKTKKELLDDLQLLSKYKSLFDGSCLYFMFKTKDESDKEMTLLYEVIMASQKISHFYERSLKRDNTSTEE